MANEPTENLEGRVGAPATKIRTKTDCLPYAINIVGCGDVPLLEETYIRLRETFHLSERKAVHWHVMGDLMYAAAIQGAQCDQQEYLDLAHKHWKRAGRITRKQIDTSINENWSQLLLAYQCFGRYNPTQDEPRGRA